MSDWPVCHIRCQQGAALLLELCLVAACVMMLSFWGMPGLARVSARHKKIQTLEQLEQSIQLAKNEALATRRPMILCGSSDGQNCTLQRDWGPYWLVGEAEVTSSLATIRLKKPLRVYRLPASHKLAFNLFYGGAPHYLVIRPNGQTHNNGTFTCTYFDGKNRQETKLRVNNLLRTYQEQ